jgi:ATP/ADP translocase/HEAT repeat protein
MKIKEKIISTLNIRRGEEFTILLLLIFSFFMGTSSAFFYTAATSLFLENFDTKMLSYAYIASGAVGYLMWVISSKLEKKLSVPGLLITYLVLLTLSVLLFSLSEYFFPFRWLSFLMYIWIRAFTFIGAIVFWILAGRLFNLRQGKRLFGLISSGEVISDIIGFFSIPLLLQFISASDLIFIALIALLFCIGILTYITKVFKGNLITTESNTESSISNSNKSGLFQLLKTKYFLYLFLLALLPMFAIYFVDYLFLDQTKIEYPDRNVLASFLGIFFGITAIAEFIIKTFLSGRLIGKYGIKLGLSALPLMLALCAILATLSGALYGASAMFFAFIALMKLSERVLRSSLGDPAFQILYQPLPAEERFTFQSKMEGIPKAIGNTLGGFTLLLFTSLTFLNIVHYNFIFLIILFFWIRIAFKMYHEYRTTLKSILEKQRKHSSKKRTDESIRILKDNIEKEEGDKLIDLIRLLEKIDPIELEDYLPEFLLRANLKQKEILLRLIEARVIITSLDEIEFLLERDENNSLFEQLKSVEDELKSKEQLSFEKIEQLSSSDYVEDRILAARLIGYSGRYDAIKLLLIFLNDNDYRVRTAAIIAVGKIKRVELWNNIITLVAVPSFANSTISVMKIIGEPILKELNIAFARMTTDKSTKLRLIKVFEKVGTKTAIDILHSKILDPDKDIRDRVLIALGKLNYHASHSEFSFISQTIEREIEITVWLMAVIIDFRQFDKAAHLSSSLESELKNKRERIFHFLSLLYDYKTIQHIRENIESGDNEKRVYALEILDLIVQPEIKEMLIPLLEDVSYEDCIALFDHLYPQQKLSLSERLIDIINKDFSLINRWTKVCAIELTSYYHNEATLQTLAANLINPDFMIYENAARTLMSIAPLLYRELFDQFPAHIQKNLLSIQTNNLLLSTDEVKLLKSLPIFRNVDEIKLVDFVSGSLEIPKLKGETIPHFENYMYYYFLVVKGEINCTTPAGEIIHFPQNSIIGEFNYAGYLKEENVFTAVSDSLLLQFRLDILYSYLDDDTDLANGIISSLYEQNKIKRTEHEAV